MGGHPRSSQATPRSSSYSMCPSGHMSVPSFAWLALLTGHHHLGAPSSAPCNPAFHFRRADLWSLLPLAVHWRA